MMNVQTDLRERLVGERDRLRAELGPRQKRIEAIDHLIQIYSENNSAATARGHSNGNGHEKPAAKAPAKPMLSVMEMTRQLLDEKKKPMFPRDIAAGIVQKFHIDKSLLANLGGMLSKRAGNKSDFFRVKEGTFGKYGLLAWRTKTHAKMPAKRRAS